jgi:acyl carrier protein
VVLAQRQGSELRLVAYVVPSAPDVTADAELTRALRARLFEQLPAYMMPAAFVVLPALPLTPNGKIDRKALPVPAAERPQLERPYVAPRDAVEAVIAGIWAGVLSLPQVGVDDSFFDLGGHSLLAMQVVARVREAFKVDVPLRTLLETPTVANLARALVARESRPGQLQAIAAVHQKLQRLTPEQIARLLEEKRRAKAG